MAVGGDRAVSGSSCFAAFACSGDVFCASRYMSVASVQRRVISAGGPRASLGSQCAMRREPSDRTSDVRRETRIWTAHTRIRIHKLILGRTRSVSVAGLCRVREVRPDK